MNTTTNTRPTIHGRAAAERLLGVVDEKSLSVADAAAAAGLPVAEVEGLLHLRPSLLSAETAARLAGALGVTLPPPVECPAWCQTSHGDHVREAVNPLFSWYFHTCRVAQTTRATVELAVCQNFDQDAAPDAVGVHLTFPAGSTLTPTEARAVAAALVEAATLAEA